MKIYLLNFNNYYNRQVKRFDTIEEYMPYINGEIRNDTNFKPNDGINTNLIQNNINALNLPDYLLAEEEDTGIFTRWFVMDCVRLRGGQYNLSLRRDLLAENIDEVLNSPCYIEKATLNNNDPMIVNDEKFPVNQIKKQEIALYDYTYVPWVVQYLPSDIQSQIDDSELIDDIKVIVAEIFVSYQYRYETSSEAYIYENYLNTPIAEDNNMFSVLLAENGKYILRKSLGKYVLYKLCVYIETYEGKSYLSLFSKNISDIKDENVFDTSVKFYLKTGIRKTNLVSTSKSPYVMLCAPYSDLVSLDKSAVLKAFQSIATKYGSGKVYDTQILPYCPLRNLSVTGRGNTFEERMSNPAFDINGGSDIITVIYNSQNSTEDLSEIRRNTLLGYCYENSFTFNINIDMNIKPNDNIKLINQTEMLRICSPNYAGSFEFNRAKNGGFDTINVDCTYKPYNPYIHLNPNFSFLYGKDFNDNRGLICAGDFSVDQETSAWADYQMNNKNYEAIFNREIENLEYNHKWDMTESVVGAGAGAVTGAMTGMFVGGPAGAVAGGIASGVGGVLDIAKSQATYSEALDYKKDLFGYNIANIKAIPNTLAKTSAINYNSKYVPFIEVYDCTEEEKQSFLNKIKYNGMTVNRIGLLDNFVRDNESYVKGKIIRIDIREDFHYVNELTNEVDKGFFIKRSDI